MNRGVERTGPNGRYRDFFDLQLRFAEAVAAKTPIELIDAVFRCTNLHRRFGLGDAPDDAPGAAWQRYARQLARLETHDDRLRLTQAFYAQSPDERTPFPDQVFGCFEYHVNAETGIVRLHFYNRDPAGALCQARMVERRRELACLFAHLCAHHRDAATVQGFSWLYGTQAYCRLFPVDYVQSAEVAETGARFQGMSRWGSFSIATATSRRRCERRFYTTSSA